MRATQRNRHVRRGHGGARRGEMDASRLVLNRADLLAFGLREGRRIGVADFGDVDPIFGMFLDQVDARESK